MKTMSFLAGMATGVLLGRSMAHRASAHRVAPSGGVLITSSESDRPTHAPPLGDDEVRERIRAQLARIIADPDAVLVEVSGGCVTLTGQVHARDSVLLMATVENMGGVREVRSGMQILGSLDGVAPPMTRDRPAVRAGERASSHMT